MPKDISLQLVKEYIKDMSIDERAKLTLWIVVISTKEMKEQLKEQQPAETT